MAIRLIFTIQREMIRFIITGKTVLYTDRKLHKWIQFLPRDEEFLKKIANSPLVKLFDLTEEEKKEYLLAKDEEALAVLVARDCGTKGCRLLSKQNVEITDASKY